MVVARCNVHSINELIELDQKTTLIRRGGQLLLLLLLLCSAVWLFFANQVYIFTPIGNHVTCHFAHREHNRHLVRRNAFAHNTRIITCNRG